MGSRCVLIVRKFFLAFSLDYPGVGPEHSFLKDVGRAEYYCVTDEEALEGTEDYILLFLFWGAKYLNYFHFLSLLRI